MTTAIQKRKPEVPQQFTQDQIDLIKSQIAPEATNAELKLFIYHAQRTGLDPLARQIYCIHRNVRLSNGNYGKKMTIQTSIDGFRVIAERSGSYAGQSEPRFKENERGTPTECAVSVYRFANKAAGLRYEAAIGVARWSEYVQTDREGKVIGLWAKMPHTMLAKVAEALALRKAFPQDLSGIYTGDEMAPESEYPSEIQNGKTLSIPTPPEVKAEKPNLTPGQLKKAITRIQNGEPEVLERMEEIFNLTEEQRAELKSAKPIIKKPSLSQEEFLKALQQINEGIPGVVEYLETNHSLTKEQEQELQKVLG